MKKLLLTFIALFACVSYVAADEVKFDFTTNQYGQVIGSSTNDKYMEDGASFSDGAITVTANKLTGSGVRFWDGGATANPRYTFRCNKNSGITVSIDGGTISKIVFTGTNCNSFKVDGTAITNMTWEGSSSSVAFVNGGTKTVQIKTMTVTYTGGAVDNREDAGLAFSATEVEAILGEAFNKPTLTKATTADVVYSSSDEAVATVDAATGDVTIVGLGTAKITAKAEANDEYKAGNASYTITVVEPLPEGTIYASAMGVDFTFENPTGISVWKHDATYGLKGSAYVSGKANATEAIAASPVIDLTDKENVKLVFATAFNNYKKDEQMISVADFTGYAYVVAREEGATEWTVLEEMSAPAAFSWDFYDVSMDIPATYNGKKVQFGYKYVSTAEVAGTWEVKQISVTGDKTTAIEDIEAADAPVEYFNLQGIRVANPTSGLYIKRQGNKVTKVIL